MIKNIVAKLKGIYIGWDYDKYWDSLCVRIVVSER